MLHTINDTLARATGWRLLRESTVKTLRAEKSTFGLSPADQAIVDRSMGLTMVSRERLVANLDSTAYVVANRHPGAFVECGVWRGGSIMVAMAKLAQLEDVERDVYLFDTFEGMTEPTAADVNYKGEVAADIYPQRKQNGGWCQASLEDVKLNISGVPYPADRIRYVQGDVAHTLPMTDTGPIAWLRLDTDFYESTKAELDHLYDRLVPGGVLILDDYGHWAGARQAVDEFFASRGLVPYLARIDYCGRVMIKE